MKNNEHRGRTRQAEAETIRTAPSPLPLCDHVEATTVAGAALEKHADLQAFVNNPSLEPTSSTLAPMVVARNASLPNGYHMDDGGSVEERQRSHPGRPCNRSL